MSLIQTRARRASRWATWLAAGVLAFGASGCFFEASTDAGPAPAPLPPPPGPLGPGTLTLRWNVTETTDPNSCVIGNTPTFDVILTTSSGQFAGEFQASCASFATSVSSLVPGDYTGSAVLLDPQGRPRTTTVYIQTFTIIENTNLVVDLDFPASSFL